MATWEERIVTILSPIFSTKVWPVHAAQNIAQTYCAYQLVGGSDNVTLDGDYNLVNARIQLTIVCKSQFETTGKCRQTREAMRNASTSGLLRSVPYGPGFDLPGDDTELYGRILEYSIWHNEAD